MKLGSQLLILALSVAFIQGCSNKPKELTTEEIAAIEKAKADSIGASLEAEKSTKRANLEQEISAKAEKRRLAAAEKVKASRSYKDAKGKTIYLSAETMPVYEGGENELSKYLKDNLQYPAEAKDNGEEGTVFVDFVIDQKGKVRDVVATDAVNDNVNPALREESVRVVSSMPAWKPAMNKGKAVDAAYSIPIKFELN